MVKFTYKHGGDHRYHSPFTGIDHVFVGDNPSNFDNVSDIEHLRKIDAYIEIDPPVIKIEIPTVENVPEIKKVIPIGKSAPITKTKSNKR